jgi:hypothetical protein
VTRAQWHTTERLDVEPDKIDKTFEGAVGEM